MACRVLSRPATDARETRVGPPRLLMLPLREQKTSPWDEAGCRPPNNRCGSLLRPAFHRLGRTREYAACVCRALPKRPGHVRWP